MNQLHLEFEVAFNLLKGSKGKNYRIYSKSDSGADFSINAGTITGVGVDRHNDLLLVHLDDDIHNIERFSLNALREIKTVEKESYTMIQPIYKDGTYFKIYIADKGGK